MDVETDADEDAVFENPWRTKRNPHCKFNKGRFTQKEEQIVTENWNKFQKVSCEILIWLNVVGRLKFTLINT